LFNYLLDKKEDTHSNKEKEEVSHGLGLALSTVKGIRRTLWGVFTFAVVEQLINENPIPKTKLPEAEDISANPLTMEEALKFVAVQKGFWYRDAFAFQLHTGVRPQELMALIWDDIDFDKQTIRIERSCIWLNEHFTGFGPPKSARSKRTIETTPEVMELLRRHREKQQREIDEHKKKGTEYGEPKLKEWITKNRSKQRHLYNSAKLIFPTVSGTVPNPQIPRKQFKEMLLCAGISRSGIRWFDLRHTHACILISLGIRDVEVAERLGHSLTTFQSTYANALPDRRRVAAIVLGNVLPVLIPNSNDNPSEKSEED
jgi:integrase